ncbi:hypothetical protein RB614_37910 [Phytohabitans sp. ZYX-F-186]|uniref:DUF1508 domain-containing protein n=1 Tax=Phytohabitans maris TaxID=3071409 RepID=A0ABU0ZTI1_9ACTN|nr:hypothetical protein [Phytohabitans sp. ZYX-F-186]MDQ7910285.1 hypothetical protein [Phytohabitans sp. ZYX-F-186]
MQQDELAEIDVTEDEFDAMMAASEPVEVTGPADSARNVRFEVISGASHTYRWRVVAPDGEILAVSANAYRSRGDVHRALSLLVTAMQHAPVVDDEEMIGHRKAG